MNETEIKKMLEAVLFASAEPLESQKIAQALEIDEIIVDKLLSELSVQYEKTSGLRILKLDDKYQLCTAPEFAPQIRSVLEVKRNAPLSQAAFEVLAVIAYNQPVTKAFVEQVRGVDCSGVIASLCKRKLIEEKGRLELPGRPLVYGTTANFLRCFSMTSLSELPKIPENKENDSNAPQIEKNDEVAKTDLAQGVDENKNLE